MKSSSLLKAIKLKFKFSNHKESQTLILGEPSSDFDLSSKDRLQCKDQYKKKAAVFFLLKETSQGLRVIFTKRAKNLSSHPGQISFPGGIVEKNDSSILNAGLREVGEEIGLSKNTIQTVGSLRPHETVSKFLIHPFVGIMDSSAEFKINTCEVAELFEVPLDFLLDRNNMTKHKIPKAQQYVGYYAIPYGPYYIWGATARIIKSFVERFYD